MDHGGEIAAQALTRNILFGLNVVSLVGFALMGFSLSLSRQGRLRRPAAFALMGAGTALLFIGLYVAAPATP